MKRQKRIWLGLLLAAGMVAMAGCTSAQNQQTQPEQTGVQPIVDQTPSGATQNAQITEEQAKQIALAHAGCTEDQAQYLQVRLDQDDGVLEYDVEFLVGQIEYDYEIDANTGEIRTYDFDAEYNGVAAGQTQPSATQAPTTTQAPVTTQSGDIGQEKAKSIALEHAGLSESDVTFTKVKQDRDDGRLVYELEFYQGQVEYDYEIDAQSGDVLSYERDSHTRSQSTTQQQAQQTQVSTSENVIEQSKAKSIAFQHAGVSESQVSRLKVQLDRDDGRLEYEVEFHVGQMEYNYEINATSGSIISHEKEIDD